MNEPSVDQPQPLPAATPAFAPLREPSRAQVWLAVVCGGAGLLLPLTEAGEVSPFHGCVEVPHARPWFLGIANLHGQVHGVVDLGGFLGLSDAYPRSAGSWVVAFNARLDCATVLRVDQLAGLRRADELMAIDGPSEAAARPRFAGACFRDAGAGGRSWQEIRLAELVGDAHFLDIVAR